jgi:Resolvase, N terminal domain
VKLTRVAIYTRVSTDDQSTKTQDHELKQYAKHRNWTVQRRGQISLKDAVLQMVVGSERNTLESPISGPQTDQ